MIKDRIMIKDQMPLKIQLFADGEAVTETEEKTQDVESGATEKPEEKTFTQNEVNSLLAKERRKLPSEDELKEFNEWKSSRQTVEEKYNEVLKDNEALKKKLNYAENITAVANAGVDKKFQKFVVSEISELDGDFSDNLTSYLKDNAQYLVSQDLSPKSTGFSQQSTNKSVNEDIAYLQKKYANNPYYKG